MAINDVFNKASMGQDSNLADVPAGRIGILPHAAVPSESSSPPAFLVIDTESVPDGKLLARTKYPADHLSPEEAVARAQAEARELSPTKSDFVPVSYHYPVAVCVLRAGADFGLQDVTCLDAPKKGRGPGVSAERDRKGFLERAGRLQEQV